MGYEYELLGDFAEEAGVELVMRVVPRDSLLLNLGVGDVAAARIVPMEQDTANFAYTTELYRTRGALVQREGPPGEALPAPADTLLDVPPETLRVNVRRIERPADLAGETVYLPDDSPYVSRLLELEDRITGDIRVVVVDTTSEALIREVAEESRESERWRALYRKYYVDRRAYRERAASAYLTAETGTLSDWDALLREHAAEVGWDWRLLAAQTYQESRFDPRATSWAGAMGL